MKNYWLDKVKIEELKKKNDLERKKLEILKQIISGITSKKS